MLKNKKLWIILAITLAVVTFFVIKDKQKKAKGTEVAIEKSAIRNIIETVTASGKIYAQDEVKISSDVSGEIVALYVKEGDYVQKGQLLAKIQPESYQAYVEQAEASLNGSIATYKNAQAQLSNLKAREKQVSAQLENAKDAYDRAQQLFSDNNISKADLEQAKTAYRTALSELDATKETIHGAQYSIEGAQAQIKASQAQIREARNNLSKTTIYAPMSGTISALNVEEGEKVVGTLQMSGTEILRISNLTGMEVRVDVSENEVIKIVKGDTAEVEIDAYLGRKFKGIVTEVALSSKGMASGGLAAVSNDQSTNFVVKVMILPESYSDLLSKNRDPFLPGMSATVEIKTEIAYNVVAAPVQGVTTRDNAQTKEQEEVVFVVKEGKAEKVLVSTGLQDDTYIEIKSGLKNDASIIIAPYNFLSKTIKPGDKVTVVDKDKLKPEEEEED
jgi:HlyD family secretion protein